MQSPFVPFAAIATMLVLALSSFPSFAAEVPVTACGAPETASANLEARAQETGQLTIFLTAIEAAGMTDLLKTEGPYTLFAPSDAAFAKLPAGTVEALLKDEESLRAILMYHWVAGQVSASEAAHLRTAQTLYGEALTLTLERGVLFVDRSRVTRADLRARNGVIHVIDDVVVPTGTRTASY
ncbi:MAG: fasciclin domain-containing protein [Myxococcota bacterium]